MATKDHYEFESASPTQHMQSDALYISYMTMGHSRRKKTLSDSERKHSEKQPAKLSLTLIFNRLSSGVITFH